MKLIPRKQPVQKRSLATVASILEGAAQVLECEGIDGFTTNAIAQRAGVSIGTLYQYYPDKAAIAAALSRQMRGSMVQRIADAAKAAEALPLGEGLRLLALAAIQSDVARPRFAQLLDALEANLGLNDEEASAIDEALTALVTDFLETQLPDASRTALAEAADEIRATAGALADVSLGRSTTNADILADRIAVVALALLDDRFKIQPPRDSDTH